MRAVLQRVSSASVQVDGRAVGAIDRGLLVLLGVEAGDRLSDVEYITSKIRDLRLFADEQEKMNRSVVDVGGGVLLISQFTLLADCRRGRRPSFDAAAAPDEARALYEECGARLRREVPRVETGEFQAMMQVTLVNDGPVTVLLDSRKRF
jgi:D-tyrosyl-tRNA(Tyr) deacylase